MSADRRVRPVTWTRYLLLGMVAGLLAAACGGAVTPVPMSTQTAIIPLNPAVTEAPVTVAGVRALIVRVDELDFPVELAVTPDERIKGLSGRASLDAETGMLFVFEKAERLRFWMREMEFPLDMVWISSGCRVVDVSENVPIPDPGTSLNDLPRYSPESPAKYVLEINGGEARVLGLGIGDTVEFLDALEGLYGC